MTRKTMKVCLVGEYSGSRDEGMKNTASYLIRELSKHLEVLPLDVKSVFRKTFWKQLRSFKPQIIHYVPGPSLISFILAKVLSLYSSNAKVVMSAVHPSLSSVTRRFVSLLKPDLILTQSYDTEEMFNNLGLKTEFLPSGVDVERFIPVSTEARNSLRDKYGLSREDFIVLHVGSIAGNRNLQVLPELQKMGNRVIIVGSTSTKMNRQVYQMLKQGGCWVWTDYFENLEEVYALSDCYVFPTTDRIGCIELPLSILEAMSCNLPVISTRFGAVPRVFEEGDGLFFIREETDFHPIIDSIKNGTMEIRTREKVLPYSWEKIASKLGEVYEQLLTSNSCREPKALCT
ncbi:MAG: glycosyltransferase family 4 protein [Dehalococcoidales bacterium]|nr:glycosyltransferase family 4 protein [Dehalococcoidales bacterium]